jgi:hypothetical protein
MYITLNIFPCLILMYKCLFCKIFLAKSSNFMWKQHEKGNRHRMKISIYYNLILLKWISIKIKGFMY